MENSLYAAVHHAAVVHGAVAMLLSTLETKRPGLLTRDSVMRFSNPAAVIHSYLRLVLVEIIPCYSLTSKPCDKPNPDGNLHSRAYRDSEVSPGTLVMSSN